MARPKKAKAGDELVKACLKKEGYSMSAMLTWEDKGDYVVVITTDGKKLRMDKVKSAVPK